MGLELELKDDLEDGQDEEGHAGYYGQKGNTGRVHEGDPAPIL